MVLMHILVCSFSKDSYLSQDLATQNDSGIDWLECLEQLRPHIEAVIPHECGYKSSVVIDSLESLKKSFEKDYERMGELEELLFGEDITAYGERCASVFSRWEDEGGGPSLLSMLARAWEFWGFPEEGRFTKAAVMSAVLAEVPNNMQYHGNEHYRKVLFHVIRMIRTHNLLYADDELELSFEEVAILLIAGTVHDLGHEGGDNMRDGIFTPGNMEQKAIDIGQPYFESVGLMTGEQGILETLIFCTDITFNAGDNSPCVRMRKIYNYYFIDQSDDSILNYMMGKLRRFDEAPKMALIAMMLHEADIGTSAGLTYRQSIKETIDIMEERCVDTAGPGLFLAFLKEQLEGEMKTECGKAIFGPGMKVIMEEAIDDFNAGRKTFYEERPEQ
jgi:hypothetical protein